MVHVYFQFLEALVNMGVPVNGTGSFGLVVANIMIPPRVLM